MEKNKIEFFLELKAEGAELVKDYKEQIINTSEAVKSLATDANKTENSLNSLAESSSDISSSVKDLNSELNKTSKVTENTSKSIKKINKNTKELNNENKSLENNTEELNNELKKEDKSLKDIANNANKTSKEIKNLSEETSKSEKVFKKFFAYAVGAFAIGSIVQYTKAVAESIDQIALNSNKAGVEFNKFKAYGEVSRRFGINIDQLSDKFIQLNEFVSEAATRGSGSGFEVLQELNIDAKELIKLDPADQFERIVKATKDLPINYRNQLLSALSLDDLIPLVNNIDKVQERIDKLNKNGLFINPEGVVEFKNNINEVLNDLNSFSMVVVNDLYRNLSEVYNLESDENSLLNGDNARNIAKGISLTVQSLVVLGKTLNLIKGIGQLAFTGVKEGVTGLIDETLAKTNSFFVNSKYEDYKKQLYKTYKDNPIELDIQLNILEENKNKVLKDIRDINIDAMDERNEKLLSSLDQAYEKSESLLNSFRDYDINNFGSSPLILEISKDAAVEAVNSLQDYKDRLIQIEQDIESANLDVIIDPKNIEKAGKLIQERVIEKLTLLKKIQEDFKNSGFTIIDTKNAEIEVKKSLNLINDFYDKAKQEQRALFEKGTKIFKDDLQIVNLEFELSGKENYDEIYKKLFDIYNLYEDYVKLNGNTGDLLQVQLERLSKIKMLKELEFKLNEEDLKLEDLKLELLNNQERVLESIQLSRERSIRDIKRQFTDIEKQAEAIDLTNKIFDIQNFKQNLIIVEKELEELNNKLLNTDFFDFNKRNELENQINNKTKERIDLQGKLGEKQEEVNEGYIFTVERINKLNEELKNSFIDIFSEFASGTLSAKEAFNSFATFFLKKISEMILEQMYLNTIGKLGSGGESGAGLGSLFMGAMSSIPFFHTGGTVGVTQPLMQVPGITKNDESLAVLKKGEQVLTKNQQFNNGNNKGSNNIVENNIIIDSDSLAKSTLESQNGIDGVLKILRKNKDQIKNILD